MYNPAVENAGYPSGPIADKDANQETTLGSAYSPVDYMSITSFPRLPEDEVLSGDNALRSRKDDDCLSDQDTGQSIPCHTSLSAIPHYGNSAIALLIIYVNCLICLICNQTHFSTDPDGFLKSARLQRLPSSASDLASHDISPLQETTVDPLAEGCACQRDGLTVIITACLTFATGVTIALIMQIYFGDPQVCTSVCFAVPSMFYFCLDSYHLPDTYTHTHITPNHLPNVLCCCL
jgi:gamma-glutamyltranspeptidase/glutathione hydrolase